MNSIDATISLHSIDSVLNANEREEFRTYVAHRLEREFECSDVRVQIRATDRTTAIVDGNRSQRVEKEIQAAFDAFCSG